LPDFELVALLAMSFGHRFCSRRKGGKGGGGSTRLRQHGLGFRTALVGTGWAISVFLSMSVGPPLLTRKLISCCVQAIIG